MMALIKIDNKDYDTDKLSEDARKQLVNLRLTDQEIQRVQMQLAIAQTARIAYAKALQAALPAESESLKLN